MLGIGTPEISLILLVMIMPVILFALLGWWKIFDKAGKPGWACLIPIYNVIVFMEIINKPLWWIILLIIPIVNIPISIIITHRLSLSFGKDSAFTVGLIFLSIIFLPILAYGDSQYRKLEN